MKRNISRWLFLSGSILSLTLVTIFSFAPPEKHPGKSKKKAKTVCAGCSTSCDLIVTDCYASPSLGSCPSAGCTSVWKVSNLNSITQNATTVSFSGMSVCYVPAGTPTWTTFSQIGKIMNASYRPTATRVFTATSSIGGTFSCTVYATGELYFYQTGGTVAGGPAVQLTGSFTK